MESNVQIAQPFRLPRDGSHRSYLSLSLRVCGLGAEGEPTLYPRVDRLHFDHIRRYNGDDYCGNDVLLQR